MVFVVFRVYCPWSLLCLLLSLSILSTSVCHGASARGKSQNYKDKFLSGSTACGRAVPGLAASIGELGDGSCALLQHLWDMQHPANCRKSRLLVIDFEGFQGDGFGSIVHSTASALAEAFYENRTLVFGATALPYKPGPWSCPEHDLLCYFLPLSSCTLSDTTPEERAQLYHDPFSDEARLRLAQEERGNVAALVAPNDYRSALVTDLEGMKGADPSADLHRLWTSLVYNYVFRPRLEVLNYLHTQTVNLGGAGRLWARKGAVGVHVRRGDTQYASWKKSVYSISTYTTAIKELAPLISAEVAFIATDSPAAVRELQGGDGSGGSAALLSLQVKVATRKRLPEARISNQADSVATWARTRGGSEGETLALEALADIYLLSECEALVGTGSSHFVAVANVLRVAKGFFTAPTYVDADKLEDGSHSVGLLHIANLAQGQVAEKPRRWTIVYERFVNDPLAAHRAGSGMLSVGRSLLTDCRSLFTYSMSRFDVKRSQTFISTSRPCCPKYLSTFLTKNLSPGILALPLSI
jgi:hypothetical protein